MTITFLDCETTYQVIEGKKNPSPYDPKNKLVSLAYTTPQEQIDFKLFYHELSPVSVEDHISNREIVQAMLDDTTLLVCHNTKFDLAWLWESGFKYTGVTDCTMNTQYVLNRGLKKDLSLAGLCEFYNLKYKKEVDLIEPYLTDNISMEYVPVDPILKPYNIADISSLRGLWLCQQEELNKRENTGLIPTIKMMNEYTKVLIVMETNGIKIDMVALEEVKNDYIREQRDLKIKIGKMVADVMGDTPVNLDSPEQLSQLIYSRKVINKKEWKTIFNIGTEQVGPTIRPKRRPRMSVTRFVKHVRSGTEVTYKTSASQCAKCIGKGSYAWVKKTGEPALRPKRCNKCDGVGVIYKRLAEIAGFKHIPQGAFEAAAGGFKTNSDVLQRLAETTLGPEREFFVGVSRLNSIDTYLNTYVAGIEKAVGSDDILHTQYMQCVAATGRLVSRNPNLQNQPRGHTFPIRRVFVSRFKGGVLTDADQGQLEYRTAVFLANDSAGRADIAAGIDTHQITADIIDCTRQDAKAHTFKPLYGGSTGTSNEKAYYKFFMEKHSDIAEWHEELQTEAITTKKIVSPSGREYAFPMAVRTVWGGSTNATQIKNYPVQGFATADIVPVWIIELWYLWQEYKPKSLLCLTTHDNCVVDTHPSEQTLVKELILEAHRQIPSALKCRYDINLDIPLMVEVKQGVNLLSLETVVKETVG